jgi:hypothetical protein
MKFLYWILHTFVGCQEEDLEYDIKGSRATCKKCGRVYFIFGKY